MKLVGGITMAELVVFGHGGGWLEREPDGDFEVCATSGPEEWFAQNVNASDLTWEALSEHSPDERLIIDRSVDDDIRQRLRQDHLGRMYQDDRFSVEQREIIGRARDWYGTARDPDLARSLAEEVSGRFSREEAWRAFRSLGPERPNVPSEAEDSSWRCKCRFNHTCPQSGIGKWCVRYVCVPRRDCGWMGRQLCVGLCFNLFST